MVMVKLEGEEPIVTGLGAVSVVVRVVRNVLSMTVTGPESAERYAELAAAVDEHCPVLDLFKNPVPVTRVIAATSVAAASA